MHGQLGIYSTLLACGSGIRDSSKATALVDRIRQACIIGNISRSSFPFDITGAHAIPEQEKGFNSKCTHPQDVEAVSGFHTPRQQERMHRSSLNHPRLEGEGFIKCRLEAD
jgi:hypothetical protein